MNERSVSIFRNPENDIVDLRKALSSDATTMLMNNKSGFAVVPKFLSRKHCDKLINYYRQNKAPQSHEVSLPLNAPLVHRMLVRLRKYMCLETTESPHIVVREYISGSSMSLHHDCIWDKEPKFNLNRCTFIIYLNHDFTGGQTVFPAMQRIITPRKGKLLCFSNKRPDGSNDLTKVHRVTTVASGTRYVVLGGMFLRYQQ